tara:strand:+ start:287 stop:1543 length:1257 start_codon:yes stop_codon:yes gene_type:complete
MELGTPDLRYVSEKDYSLKIKNEVMITSKIEEVPLYSITGRILAEDLHSRINIPEHPKSLIDGFALRSKDTINASQDNPISLKMIGSIELEKKVDMKIKQLEVCYIPTGGYLPNGADATVKIEEVEVYKDRSITLINRVPVGEHVTSAGLDIAKNQIVFNRGHKIRPKDIALFATLKIWRVKILKKPRIAIISVGTELTDNIIEAKGDKKFAGISLSLAGLVYEAGGEPIVMGTVKDDKKSIKKKIQESMNLAEAVLTIGGTSKGVKDLVATSINESGRPGLIFRGIDIVPGRVSGFGIIDGKPIVMMPGLIQSTLVAFYFIALPLIRRLYGLEPTPSFYQIQASLTEDIQIKSPEFNRLLFVKLRSDKNKTLVQPVSKLGNASLIKPIVDADGFIIFPKGPIYIRKETQVTVNLLHF